MHGLAFNIVITSASEIKPQAIGTQSAQVIIELVQFQTKISHLWKIGLYFDKKGTQLFKVIRNNHAQFDIIITRCMNQIT